MSSLVRFAFAAMAVLLAGPAAGVGHAGSLDLRDQAAQVSAASRLVSAYGIVTSTFRSAAHNKAVGGVPNSFHLVDRAIDIARRPGVTHRQIEAALRKAGYNLIESLDELDHSHFAFAALPRPAPASPPPSAPPATVSNLLPRVAADSHGTLSIDLQAQAGTTTSVAPQ